MGATDKIKNQPEHLLGKGQGGLGPGNLKQDLQAERWVDRAKANAKKAYVHADSGSPSSDPEGSENESELQDGSEQQGFAWMGTFLNVGQEPVEPPAPPPSKGTRARRPRGRASVLAGAALVLVAGGSAYGLAAKDELPPIVVGSASGEAPADEAAEDERRIDDKATVTPAAPTPSAAPTPQTAAPVAAGMAAAPTGSASTGHSPNPSGAPGRRPPRPDR